MNAYVAYGGNDEEKRFRMNDYGYIKMLLVVYCMI